ncbi:unnamed protein product, partial [Phaeothamnion confervicola]
QVCGPLKGKTVVSSLERCWVWWSKGLAIPAKPLQPLRSVMLNAAGWPGGGCVCSARRFSCRWPATIAACQRNAVCPPAAFNSTCRSGHCKIFHHWLSRFWSLSFPDLII